MIPLTTEQRASLTKAIFNLMLARGGSSDPDYAEGLNSALLFILEDVILATSAEINALLVEAALYLPLMTDPKDTPNDHPLSRSH